LLQGIIKEKYDILDFKTILHTHTKGMYTTFKSRGKTIPNKLIKRKRLLF